MDEYEHVLRITRSDDSEGFVLLNVSSNGPQPLDLRVLGTEGENPFVLEMKHARTSAYQDPRSQLSSKEWQDILGSVLLQQLTPASFSHSNPTTEKIETRASISKSTLTIHFRKNISGITQRLGSLALKEDEDVELDTISWTSTALQRSARLETEILELHAKYDSATHIIKTLNKQLDDLTQAKREHEDALLTKFCELLNNKKLKIRDQQRLLAAAKVDPERAKAVSVARGATLAAAAMAEAGPSRAGKRKTRAEANGEDTEDGSDEDEFESMAPVEGRKIAFDEEAVTPEAPADSETEDESADEGTQAKGPGTIDAMQLDSPPPARQLPFSKPGVIGGKKKQDVSAPPLKERTAPPTPPLTRANQDEDEESTTDDEL